MPEWLWIILITAAVLFLAEEMTFGQDRQFDRLRPWSADKKDKP